MSLEDKVLWLNDDCVFVALQEKTDKEPKMIIVNHQKGVHYTPKNESAKEMLHLLAKKTDKGKGIHYKDLKKSMLNLFTVTEQNVDEHLTKFLKKLDEKCGVLASKKEDKSIVPPAPKKEKRTAWDGDVVGGGSLCCLGYGVTYYYWP